MMFNYIELAKMYDNSLREEFQSNTDTYMDSEYECIQYEEALEERAMQQVIDHTKQYLSEDAKKLLDEFIDHFTDTVKNYTSETLLDELKQEAIEMYNDDKEFRRNPLHYYGMRQSDFI